MSKEIKNVEYDGKRGIIGSEKATRGTNQSI